MKRFLLLFCTKNLRTITLLIGALLLIGQTSQAQQISLYTPYTHISVPPGETVNYDVQVINNGGSIRPVSFDVRGLPDSWTYSLKSGGWAVKELSVLPGEKKSFSLTLNVPLEVKKGDYRFSIGTNGYGRLPLLVEVSEEGTFKTEFTTKQANMEGAADAEFTFNAQLKNLTAEAQTYSLRSDAPRGWSVNFKANYKQATSVQTEANSTTDLTVTVNPPDQMPAGTYTIPVFASNGKMNEKLDLEVVITGNYEINLSTPTGLLSTSVRSGSERDLEMVLKNTGSAELKDIKLSAQTPADWKVSFLEETLASLPPGQSKKVTATIKASSQSIPGDYVVNITAKTPEATSKASIRTTVKTPLIWGWLGMLIILAVIGGIFYLFKKYGRR